MTRGIALGAWLVLALAFDSAHAGWFDRAIGPYNRPEPYASVGSSAVLEDFDLESGPGFDLNTEPGYQISPILGYRLSPWGAVELEGKWFEGVTIQTQSFLGSSDIEFGGWSALANGKLYVPWNHPVQPWIKGGAGWTWLEASVGGLEDRESDFSWHAGLGVDLVANDHFTFGVQGMRFQTEGDLDGFDFWTAGGFITFRFGALGLGGYGD